MPAVLRQAHGQPHLNILQVFRAKPGLVVQRTALLVDGIVF